MLDTKYLYECTFVPRVQTSITTSEYLGEPICLESDFFCDILFEFLYGVSHTVERIKIFKVAPIRGEL